MLEPSEKASCLSTVLSFSTSASKAKEIEGDLLEESRSLGKLWLLVHVGLTAFGLFRQGFIKAPLSSGLLSLAGLMAASALTTLLLFPFVFQFQEFSTLTMLLLIYFFRAVACFVVGVSLVEFAPQSGRRGVIGASVLMLLVLGVRIFLHYQQGNEYADVFLGVAVLGIGQFIIFYTLFSILPMIVGGIYTFRCLQGRFVQPACGIMSNVHSRVDSLKSQ